MISYDDMPDPEFAPALIYRKEDNAIVLRSRTYDEYGEARWTESPLDLSNAVRLATELHDAIEAHNQALMPYNEKPASKAGLLV